MKYLFALILCLMLVMPAMAQDDGPAAESVGYDSMIEDSITSIAIYDWWYIVASEGDQMVVDMHSTGELAPLIGILDINGTLAARSEDGTPGSTVTLEYTVPVDGEYRVVATRAGNENGTTTGDYQLLIRKANTPIIIDNPYQEVVFRCEDFEVTNVTSLEFADDPDQANIYRLTIYGMDGFVPVIRTNISDLNVNDCAQDFQAIEGDTYTLPGEETVTVTGDLRNYTSQITIRGAKEAGLVAFTIGSKNGSTGRYLAVLEGLTISPNDDTDYLHIGQGPLAALSPLLVYMVAGKTERLDPSMRLRTDDPDSDGIVCDDAGRRGCDDVPSIVGLNINVAVENFEIAGDRFDAGVLLPNGGRDLREIELGSFSGNTEGTYSLVLMGELPPKE